MVKSNRFIKVARGGEDFTEMVAVKQELYQNSDEKREDFAKIAMGKAKNLSKSSKKAKFPQKLLSVQLNP